jgi:hypothetical protein
MTTQTASLISTLEALFTNQVKMAEAHRLDTLPGISTTRAKMILTEIRLAKAEAKAPATIPQEPAYFKKLDAMLSK